MTSPHVIWPFLWFWATLYRADRGWGFQDNHDSKYTIEALEQQVAITDGNVADSYLRCNLFFVFKVFNVPVNKWTVPSAVLGGIVIIGANTLLDKGDVLFRIDDVQYRAKVNDLTSRNCV